MVTIMPVMIILTFIFIPIPAGALLYLFTSNIFQIFQTVVINKQLEIEENKKEAQKNLKDGVIDAKVIDAKVVDDDFHARYMVKEKTYQYILNQGEYNPLERNYVYQFGKKLDILAMQEAITSFIGIHDFKSFTPNKDKRESYVREIYGASIKEEGDKIIFTFRGNGFIKYQIRNMVGLLIQIGLYKKERDCIPEILKNKNRSCNFRTAHPEGLYLVDVVYK